MIDIQFMYKLMLIHMCRPGSLFHRENEMSLLTLPEKWVAMVPYVTAGPSRQVVSLPRTVG